MPTQPLVIGEVFPPDDVVGQWVVSMAMLNDDLTFISAELKRALDDGNLRGMLYFQRQQIARLYEAYRIVRAIDEKAEIGSFVGDNPPQWLTSLRQAYLPSAPAPKPRGRRIAGRRMALLLSTLGTLSARASVVAPDSRTRRAAVGTTAALIAFVVLVMTAAAGTAGAAVKAHAAQVLRSGQSIRICHATGNGGFALINPDIDNAVSPPISGHGGHARDIIPPFEYVRANGETGHYPGRNWDAEGMAIWTNGCVRPRPPDERIVVHVACVDVHDGTYDAEFGYTSGSTVTVAVGPNNHFSPAPEARNQTTDFNAGYVLAAFRVTSIPIGENLTWSVTSGGHTSRATATASFGLACTEAPDPQPDLPIGVFVTCVANHGSTYDAVFGYENENTDAKTIPVGSDFGNFFSPPPEGRAQPTVFTPGRNDQAVTVTGIPAGEAMTWTLTFVDTRAATATAAFETKCPQAPEPPPTGPAPALPRPLGIFATCVTRHGSRYDATFGYVNENVGVVSIPIGGHNAVRPGRAGQGQPTVFHPGFVNAAFTVHGIRTSRAVTWTVRFGGQVRIATATASLRRCLTAPVGSVADATVRKTARPRTVKVRRNVRFTILVRNVGSRLLRPVAVTDTLRGRRLQVLSARSGLGSCRVTRASRSSRIRCSARTLAPGQSFRIHMTAQGTAAGLARDRAAVTGLPRSVARATVRVVGAAPPPVTG